MTNVTDEQLGKLARQLADLFRRVREGSLDPACVTRGLQDVIDGKTLFVKKEEAALKLFPTIKVEYWHDLRVSLELLRYEIVHYQITRDHFPVSRLGWNWIRPRLLCFGRSITHEELLYEVEDRGLRLAVIEEFIAFLLSQPDIVEDTYNTSIIAAGSIWEMDGGPN